MTDELLRTLEGKLRARASELRGRMRALVDRRDRPQEARHGRAAAGEEPAPDAQAAQRTALRLAERELEEVEAALARVPSPDFGRCGACEQPIEIRRLRARPESRLCLGCERSLDSGNVS